MNTVAIDPEFAAVIPPMGQEEFNLLEANICAEGCRDPLVKWRGILLDGHNRLKICERHDIPFRTVEREFADRQAAKDWILANQLARRNLHGDQFTVLLGQLYNSRKKAAGGRSDREFGVCEVTAPKTSEVLAKAHGVSEATVRRAGKKAEELEAIAKEDPTAAKAIMAGKMKLTEVAKNLRRRAVAEQIRREPAPLPEGPFRVIAIDPPWPYQKRAADPTHRAAPPYPDMTLEEIKALPVARLARADCVLWLWTTNTFMRQAFECLDAWGFTNKTILTWVKDRMGMGDWLRGQTEHCLMAVRGKPTVTLTNQTTVLQAPLREHSRKPDEFFALVNALCPGSKFEMFAREPREGWTQWGESNAEFEQ